MKANPLRTIVNILLLGIVCLIAAGFVARVLWGLLQFGWQGGNTLFTSLTRILHG